MPTTQKMFPAYSPLVDLAKPTGRKPAAVTSVPVSIGKAVLSHAADAADNRSRPSSIFTIIISTAMMASSTRRPSAMMSAPSVMRSKLRPMICMITNTTASTIGTDRATTIPVLSPSVRKETASTMMRASKKLVMNSWKACSTMSAWFDVCVTSTPSGSSAWNSATSAASLSPSAMTLAPLAMATPTPTVSRPFRNARKEGGSWYPRRMVAMSPSRNTVPFAAMGSSRSDCRLTRSPLTCT